MAHNHTKPTRGTAKWLEAAPPSASWQEVAEASRKYDSPAEAWPDGNQRVDYFAADGGGRDE